MSVNDQHRASSYVHFMQYTQCYKCLINKLLCNTSVQLDPVGQRCVCSFIDGPIYDRTGGWHVNYSQRITHRKIIHSFCKFYLIIIVYRSSIMLIVFAQNQTTCNVDSSDNSINKYIYILVLLDFYYLIISQLVLNILV